MRPLAASTRIASASILAAAPAPAQVIHNGRFETGSFSPWTVVNTPSGQSLSTAVSMFDIDGPDSSAPPSLCAQVMAGQTAPDSGPQGVILQQTVTLGAANHYTFSCRWAASSLVATPGVSAGIFELMVNGAPIAQAVAPSLAAGERAYGSLSAVFTVPQTSPCPIGIRITRTIGAGYEVFQFVDDVRIYLTCRTDWDDDGLVTPADVAAFVYDWFTPWEFPVADFDGNGIIQPADIAAFVAAWFVTVMNGC